MKHITSDTIKKSRKIHKCDGCWDVISKGLEYSKHIFVIDGDFSVFKECILCKEFLKDNYSLAFDRNGLAYYDNLYEIDEYKKYASGQQRFDQIGDLNLSKAKQDMAGIQKTAQSAETEAGRRALLTKAFGRGDRGYNRGQQSLDQLMLQSTKEGFGGLTRELEAGRASAAGAIQTAEQAGQAQRQALQQARQKSLDALGGQLSGALTSADTELSQKLAQRQAEQKRYQDIISGKAGASFDEFSQIISPEERQQMAASALASQQAISGLGQSAYDALKGGVDYEALGFLGTGERQGSSGPIQQWKIGRPGSNELTETLESAADYGAWQQQQQRDKLLPELQRVASQVSDRDLAALGLSRDDLNKQIQQRTALGSTPYEQGGLDYESAAQSIAGLAGGADVSEEAVLRRFYDRMRGAQTSDSRDAGLLDEISGYHQTPELTRQSVASGSQASRLRALQQLSGISPELQVAEARDLGGANAFDASEARRALLSRIRA